MFEDTNYRFVIDYSGCPVSPNLPKDAFKYSGFKNNIKLRRMSILIKKDSVYPDPKIIFGRGKLISNDPIINIFTADFMNENKNYKYYNLLDFHIMVDEAGLNPDGSEQEPEKWEKYAKWGMGLATLISIAVIVNKLPGRN